MREPPYYVSRFTVNGRMDKIIHRQSGIDLERHMKEQLAHRFAEGIYETFLERREHEYDVELICDFSVLSPARIKNGMNVPLNLYLATQGWRT